MRMHLPLILFLSMGINAFTQDIPSPKEFIVTNVKELEGLLKTTIPEYALSRKINNYKVDVIEEYLDPNDIHNIPAEHLHFLAEVHWSINNRVFYEYTAEDDYLQVTTISGYRLEVYNSYAFENDSCKGGTSHVRFKNYFDSLDILVKYEQGQERLTFSIHDNKQPKTLLKELEIPIEDAYSDTFEAGDKEFTLVKYPGEPFLRSMTVDKWQAVFTGGKHKGLFYLEKVRMHYLGN